MGLVEAEGAAPSQVPKRKWKIAGKVRPSPARAQAFISADEKINPESEGG